MKVREPFPQTAPPSVPAEDLLEEERPLPAVKETKISVVEPAVEWEPAKPAVPAEELLPAWPFLSSAALTSDTPKGTTTLEQLLQ